MSQATDENSHVIGTEQHEHQAIRNQGIVFLGTEKHSHAAAYQWRTDMAGRLDGVPNPGRQALSTLVVAAPIGGGEQQCATQRELLEVNGTQRTPDQFAEIGVERPGACRTAQDSCTDFQADVWHFSPSLGVPPENHAGSRPRSVPNVILPWQLAIVDNGWAILRSGLPIGKTDPDDSCAAHFAPR